MKAFRFRITGIISRACANNFFARSNFPRRVSQLGCNRTIPRIGRRICLRRFAPSACVSVVRQLKEQMLPAKFRQFEQFLASAGMDPNTQVEEMAWALVATSTGTTAGVSSVPTARTNHRRCDGTIPTRCDGHLLQGKEDSERASSRIHFVCLRRICGRGRFGVPVSGREHRGIWPAHSD